MADFSLTTFSSKGKLLQLEYALNAVSQASSSLGIKSATGIVLAAEKKLSSVLIDPTSYSRIANLTNGIGATFSGLSPDFRVLLEKSRKLAQEHWMKFHESMGVRSLCREVAQVVQEFTQSGGVRPFGVSMLVAGGGEGEEFGLFQVDPSGAYYEWKATAIGRNMKNARTFLEKRYKADMGLPDAINTALLTLKEGFEGQMTSTNIEIGVLGLDGVFKVLTPSEVKDYLDELE